MLKQELQLILLAISFFTRIPVSLPEALFETPDEGEGLLNKASRYFALVGLLIGLLSALVFSIAVLYFPVTIAILLAMASSILITGAFHEDGWADVWDGFGGGWTVEQKLNIMKDSRLGTYGAAALFIILLLKFFSLQTLSTSTYFVVVALVVGHTLSRVLATSLILTMPYVSEDAKSKVKPLAQQLSTQSLLVLLTTGFTVLLIFLPLMQCFYLGVILLVLRQLIALWFKKQLGGYTGDCLGAAQQLSEVVIYLSLISLFELQVSSVVSSPLLNGVG